MWPSHPTPSFYATAQPKDWQNWQWQLASTIRTPEDLAPRLGFDTEKTKELIDLYHKNEQRMGELRLTPYLVSLIDPHNDRDPVALQHIPQKSESGEDRFSYSEVWEKSEDFADGENRMIQQKYPDIVLLRISNTCHSFCRFCFEKERTLLKGVPTLAGPEQFRQAVKKITDDTRVRQVLLSGGDPLIMPDQIIGSYLEELAQIPHLRTIRINTRSLLHNPYRITPELARLFAQIQKKSWENRARGVSIELGVHFNHPQEITPIALHAIRTLEREGIAVYNQTVLLKGINDRAETLAELFRTLRQEGVRLHYLSQAMAVPGTEHFRTRIRDGQTLMRHLRGYGEFRGQLPYFELSHHTGKQIIPDTMNDSFYESEEIINGKPQRIIRFLSDITKKWEVFPDAN